MHNLCSNLFWNSNIWLYKIADWEIRSFVYLCVPVLSDASHWKRTAFGLLGFLGLEGGFYFNDTSYYQAHPTPLQA